MDEIQIWIDDVLKSGGIATDWLPYLRFIIWSIALVLIASLSLLTTKRFVIKLLHRIFLRTSTRWDDMLIEHKIFENLAHIVPAIITKLLAPVVFADFDTLRPFIIKITDIYILIVLMMVIIAFMRGVEVLLSSSPAFKDKPVASYFQLTRLIIYIATAILALSIFMGQSPVVLLSAFGAMTAIIMLIFKDTILGLVASIQISTNDMVRVGDWVEMPKFNADGDVIAINLNTIKIKNWDQTVTSVPTYYFISDSFKNWRGMEESGGRRIMRSLYINLSSIKFVDTAMRERFERFHLIKDFVTDRQQDIELYNSMHSIDTEELINGRRMTNVGVFRQYIETFLKSHKSIRQDMTLMVRQMQPEVNGLPLQIYCFTSSTAWIDYEQIQADIFDHLLAAAKGFDLEVFQQPSGNDLALAGEKLAPSYS